MQKLLIVSNRLPISIVKGKKGLRFEPSVGGLATGLGSFYKSYDSTWIGWAGIELEKLKAEEEENIRARLLSEGCRPIFLSQHDMEDYYNGFCNRTIWPLLHYFPQYAV